MVEKSKVQSTDIGSNVSQLQSSKQGAQQNLGGAGQGMFELCLEIHPRSETTSLDDLENKLKSIKLNGLNWGLSKREELVHGINKLCIFCVFDASITSQTEIQEKVVVHCSTLDLEQDSGMEPEQDWN